MLCSCHCHVVDGFSSYFSLFYSVAMAVEKQFAKGNLSRFREYYMKLKSTVQEAQLNEFGKLRDDEERIEFVNKLIPEENQPVVEVSPNGKDGKKAKELKECGNKAFGKANYKEALKLYSESALVSPQDGSTTDLALTIANRSAVLYHLQEYQAAIDDINIVLLLSYPKDLKYKILERKAKCLLALKKHEEALAEFRNTIKALDDCKLPSEKKIKMQTDIQIMLGIMTKPTLKSGALNAFLSGSNDVKRVGEEYKAKLSSARNHIYEAAIDKVEIQEDPIAGRYASASGDIAAGDTILIEKAFCSVLLGEYARTNCQHCFKRTRVPYPCDKCSSVVFCSIKCKECALSTYHKYECPVFNTLHEAGVSVTVLMSLRIISQQNLQYFLQIKDELQKPRELKKYKTFDYLNVYNLVRHENIRKRDDFFERSVMALFLLRCLIKANFFGESTGGKKLSPDEKFIGSLILRHLQILQFNAHEIAELEMKQEKNLDESRSVFVGGGLFTTLALFNHSCDPGIVRYFEGTKVIVRAVKPIKKGEMIAENYGPIYSQMKKKERQEKLQSQYWFKCACIPCEEVWPTFDEIDQKVFRFRCDARKESGERYNDCRNVICVPTNTEEFMIKCFICKQMTNLFKGLKTLQETDILYQQASKDAQRGNFQAALSIYLEILTTLYEILAPPFKDFLLCQQSIRKCMLAMGNKYIREE